jgi:hypothetical protein
MNGQPMIVCPAILNRHILSFNESGLVQALSERSDKVRGAGGRRASEKTNDRHCRLLRARRERPRGRCCAYERNERAPVHSITSSG